ncbi:MAG: Lrp/AsnC family transcriptional regulator [Leptospirales bacterium]
MRKNEDDFELDDYDRRILQELQHDGGMSNQALAEKICLSPSPCLRRVHALEEAGFILKRVALLDPGKLGLKFTVMIHVRMDKHTPDRFSEFENRVRQYPEVQSCYLITGQESDYLLKAVLKDMAHFQDFLLNRLTQIDGVAGVHSSFVLRKIVDTTALPVH